MSNALDQLSFEQKKGADRKASSKKTGTKTCPDNS